MEFVEPIRDRETINHVKRILKEHGTRDYLLFLMGMVFLLALICVRGTNFINMVNTDVGSYQISEVFKETDVKKVTKETTYTEVIKLKEQVLPLDKFDFPINLTYFRINNNRST